MTNGIKPISGRLFLDTNAIIAVLSGHTKLVEIVEHADWLGISIISKLEFLAYKKITTPDIIAFNILQSKVQIFDVSETDSLFIDKTVDYRKHNNLKIADAIIAASAIINKAQLVTADKQILKAKNINCISF